MHTLINKIIHIKLKKNSRVLFLMEKINADFKIDVKDQLLISKSGYRLLPNDIIGKLEQENNLVNTSQFKPD